MITQRITINGRQYGSPDEMPPDVRRQYEDAMRAMGTALAAGKGSDTRHVISGPAGEIESSVVIRKTSYKSPDEMPPEVRQLLESQQHAGMTERPSTAHGRNVALEGGQSSVQLVVSSSGSTPPTRTMFPRESSNAQRQARQFVWDLVFWVVVALILWTFLDR